MVGYCRSVMFWSAIAVRPVLINKSWSAILGLSLLAGHLMSAIVDRQSLVQMAMVRRPCVVGHAWSAVKSTMFGRPCLVGHVLSAMWWSAVGTSTNPQPSNPPSTNLPRQPQPSLLHSLISLPFLPLSHSRINKTKYNKIKNL